MNRFKMLCTLTILLLSLPAVITAFQDTTPTPNLSTGIVNFISKDFWEKVTIALVSALLAFIGSYVLAYKKERNEPRKQLSYDKTTNGH